MAKFEEHREMDSKVETPLRSTNEIPDVSSSEISESEVEQLESHLQTLKNSLKEVSGDHDLRHPIIRAAETALQKLKETTQKGKEEGVDPGSVGVEKFLYSKRLRKNFQAIEDFLRSNNVDVPSIASISATSIPEDGDTGVNEQDFERLHLESLSKDYINNRLSAFKIPGDGRFKTFTQIEADILLLLKHSGFDDDRIAVFENEILKPAESEIRNLGRLLNNKEIPPEEKTKLRKERKEAYKKLLNFVGNALEVERLEALVREDTASASESEPKTSDFEDFESQITKTIQEYKEYYDQLNQHIYPGYKMLLTPEQVSLLLGDGFDPQNRRSRPEYLFNDKKRQVDEMFSKNKLLKNIEDKNLELNNFTERVRQVKQTNSFEELYNVIDQIGTVAGHRDDFAADDLKEKIETLRNRINYDYQKFINQPDVFTFEITRVYSIRFKVVELLKKEIESQSQKATPKQNGEKTEQKSSEEKPDDENTDRESEPISEIEDLHNRYLNLDRNVFRKDPNDPDSRFKKWSVIQKDIGNVLDYAKVDNEIRGKFLDERIVGYYHNKISDAQRIRKGSMSNVDFQKRLPELQVEARKKVEQLYTEMLFEVSVHLRRVQSKEKLQVPTDAEVGERLSGIDSFDQLYQALDELGSIQGSRAIYSAEQLKEKIKKLREEVVTQIAANPKTNKTIVIETILNPEFSGLINTGGLRDLVKKLIKIENAAARETLFETKNSLTEKRDEYREALKKRSTFSKLKGVLGMHDSRLQTLEGELDKLRTEYAKALDAALQERTSRRTTLMQDGSERLLENKYNYKGLDNREVKELFVRKVILKPKLQNQNFLESLESPLKKAVIKKTKAALVNHKWKIRLAMIAGASVLAGTGAALAVAGYKTARLGWGLTVGANFGMAAGSAVERGLVKGAQENFEGTLEDEYKNFSLDEISDAEKRITDAERKVVRAKIIRDVAAVGAAALAGSGYDTLAENYGWHETSTNSPKPIESPRPEDKVLSQSSSVEPPSSEEKTIDKAGEPQVVTEVIDSEGDAEKAFAASENKFEGTGKIPDGSDHVFKGNLGYDGPELSSIQLNQLDNYIRLSIDDAYADDSHFKLDNLEKVLPEKFEAKFGNEPWWPEGGVVVDIEFEKNEVESASVTTSGVVQNASEQAQVVDDSEASVAEPAAEDVEQSNIYTVQSGDTLWGIVSDHFKDELEGLSMAEKNQILSQVLINDIGKNPDLINSLNISSGNIDRIFPDEKLDLTIVGEEIENILTERNRDMEDSVNNTVSSAENDNRVVVDNRDVTNVSGEPTATHEVSHAAESITTPAENTPNTLPEIPKDKIIDGKYFDSPEWKVYVIEHFGSEQKFNKILMAEVEQIDRSSYGLLEQWFDEHDYFSTYNTIKELSVYKFNYLQDSSGIHQRDFCENYGINFGSYSSWQQRMGHLQMLYPHTEETTLEDLFKRHIAETRSPLLDKLKK